MADTGKAPSLSDLISKWAYDHFDIYGVAAVAIIVAAFYVWTRWDKVSKWPGVRCILEFFTPIPKADPDRYSVVVARLENDGNHEYRNLIVEALKEFEGIQVLALDRTMSLKGSVPEEKERKGSAKALTCLKKTGGSVLIWGTVLTHGGKTVPKLYWTMSREQELRWKRYDAPRAEDQFQLPAVFWSDLSEILHLLVASHYAEFTAQDGHYVADRLPPFIERMRTLLKASACRPGWDADDRAGTRVILAYALGVLGQQTGESEPLAEAVACYSEALKEWTRERVPPNWAVTQHNLGTVLTLVGERESSIGPLDEAVEAFREALKERTRERVPLDWAATQNNLGNALRALGERDSGIGRLEEAVAAFREALGERTRDRVPLQWAMTQNNLGWALTVLGEREGGTDRLESAVAAFKASLEVFELAQATHYIEGTKRNLQRAEALLKERRK